MKNFQIEIKWSFIFIVSTLVWIFVEKQVGLHDLHIEKHQYFTLLYTIIAIAIYVFALLDKRKNFYKELMTYKQGLISGLIISLIVTVFTPLTQWVVLNIITPNYFDNVIQFSVEKGSYKSAAEAEAQFNFRSYVIEGMIVTFLMGFATTAIVALFTRRRNT